MSSISKIFKATSDDGYPLRYRGLTVEEHTDNSSGIVAMTVKVGVGDALTAEDISREGAADKIKQMIDDLLD